MNDNARLWIEALRSDRFEQGEGYLRSGDKFCCLGVACEVAIENGVELEIDSSGPSIRYDRERTSLPPKIQEWLGLCSPAGKYMPATTSIKAGKQTAYVFSDYNYLANLNDTGVDFHNIADVIEDEPEGLFCDETVS